jgi:hypothetical protein
MCGCRSQLPRGLRRGSAADRLLGLGVRISPGAWMFFPFGCCVLSVRDLCDVLIIVVCLRGCGHEASIMRRLWHTKGCRAIEKMWFKICKTLFINITIFCDITRHIPKGHLGFIIRPYVVFLYTWPQSEPREVLQLTSLNTHSLS